MHPAIIIGTVRSLIVDVAMGQIPRSTERISSYLRRRMVGGGRPLLPEILGQPAPAGAKLPILNG